MGNPNSRSNLRRLAALKGEPMPEFDKSLEVPKEVETALLPRGLQDPTGDMITPHNNTDVGPDGFVVKTEQRDAMSVDDILEKFGKELGFIRITFTEQGQPAGVEWSSVRPVMTLSQFSQAMAEGSFTAEPSGDDSEGS